MYFLSFTDIIQRCSPFDQMKSLLLSMFPSMDVLLMRNRISSVFVSYMAFCCCRTAIAKLCWATSPPAPHLKCSHPGVPQGSLLGLGKLVALYVRACFICSLLEALAPVPLFMRTANYVFTTHFLYTSWYFYTTPSYCYNSLKVGLFCLLWPFVVRLFTSPRVVDKA